VESGGIGLSGYNVSLYIAYVDGHPDWKLLGSDATDKAGRFKIKYALSPDKLRDPSLLFIQAERGSALLASALGEGLTLPEAAVVNERTTVAVANAFAQFVDDRRITGNTYGMRNAAPMAANLANPQTGAVGLLLNNSPNGSETSTLGHVQLAQQCRGDLCRERQQLQRAVPRRHAAWREGAHQRAAGARQHRPESVVHGRAGSDLRAVGASSPLPAGAHAGTHELAPVPQDHGRVLQRAGRQQYDERAGELRHRRARQRMVNDNYEPESAIDFACAAAVS
jgi:hypothetical protein